MGFQGFWVSGSRASSVRVESNLEASGRVLVWVGCNSVTTQGLGVLSYSESCCIKFLDFGAHGLFGLLALGWRPR